MGLCCQYVDQSISQLTFECSAGYDEKGTKGTFVPRFVPENKIISQHYWGKKVRKVRFLKSPVEK
jgi:hypothetical protein